MGPDLARGRALGAVQGLVLVVVLGPSRVAMRVGRGRWVDVGVVITFVQECVRKRV